MFSGTSAKRLKLSNNDEKILNKNNTAESGFHSEINFSSNTSDFSLPLVKRKSLAPRRASLQQISLNLTTDTQQSSGYSSLNTSNCGSTSLLHRTSSTASNNRTPKKRKSEISESDENFYNSFQFVSPVKVRRKDANDKNCAKLVLKEKCSSENVILCSTPIRTNNKNTKWGKFRSFHPEKFQTGKSLDEPIVYTPPIKSHGENCSFNLSNLDFSNLSGGNLSTQQQNDNIPANLDKLWTDDIKHSKVVSFSLPESQGAKSARASETKTRKFHNGRIKFDILGKLDEQNDIAVREILSYLDAEALLSLSHVSQQYRHMIQSKRNYELKRLNYLKAHISIKENKLPSIRKTFNSSSNSSATSENVNLSVINKRKAFGTNNLNISQVRQKTPVTPASPSRRYNEMQKNILINKNSKFKRCPRCHKPAKINSIKIRNSPRKKKSNSIYKLSTSSSVTGRVQKRNRTFLSKTSIPESFHEVLSSPHYVTIANFDDASRSPDRAIGSDSPNSSSSSDDSCESDEIYEYGFCTSVGCSYKFCIKCNCKYHPRRICGDLSPPSPSRTNQNNSRILAGSKASRQSLKRLINY